MIDLLPVLLLFVACIALIAGKTLVYSLPLICIAVQDELVMPLDGGEGPLGLIVCPSRQLANQTVEVIQQYTEALSKVGDGAGAGALANTCLCTS